MILETHHDLTDALRLALAPLVAGSHARDLQVDVEAFVSYRLAAIAASLGGGRRAALLTVRDDTATRGALLLEALPWDTAIYGFSIGRIGWVAAQRDRGPGVTDGNAAPPVLLDAALALAAEWGVRQLSARIDAEDLALLHMCEAGGCRLADVSVALGLAAEAWRPRGPDPRIRPYRADDLPALRTIAASTFQYSRLLTDPRFPRDRSNALFDRWIENACQGRADHVLVAEIEGHAAGFVTCTIDARAVPLLGVSIGDVSLLGVAPAAQGQRVGGALVEAALAWLVPRVARVEVRTQLTNLPALRLYEKAGFRMVRGLYTPGGVTFHRWL